MGDYDDNWSQEYCRKHGESYTVFFSSGSCSGCEEDRVMSIKNQDPTRLQTEITDTIREIKKNRTEIQVLTPILRRNNHEVRSREVSIFNHMLYLAARDPSSFRISYK